MTNPPAVQSLWVGDALSRMEVLSIRSFLQNGHPYHLYAYGAVANVPKGVELRDASEILPYDPAYHVRDHRSPSTFSNKFRYRLLWAKGGWWVDTDVVCLRPFVFDPPFVFASQRRKNGTTMVASNVIAAPPGSALMHSLWRECESADVGRMRWSELGPRLLSTAVGRFALERFVTDWRVFNPIDFWHWSHILSSRPCAQLRVRYRVRDGCRAIHLWHEMWRRSGTDKNALPSSTCLYGRLARAYPPA